MKAGDNCGLSLVLAGPFLFVSAYVRSAERKEPTHAKRHSGALALVNLGRIEPYRRTYAKRQPKAPALLAGGRSTRFAVDRFLQESRTALAPHHGWRIDP